MFIVTCCIMKINTTCSLMIGHVFWYSGGFSSSVILGDLDRKNYTEKLISFLDPVLLSSQRSWFVRCWHAKTDGSAASIFHNNCDGKGPTVTIIKSGSYIFGGYTDVSWHSSKYLPDGSFFSVSFTVWVRHSQKNSAGVCGSLHKTPKSAIFSTLFITSPKIRPDY